MLCPLLAAWEAPEITPVPFLHNRVSEQEYSVMASHSHITGTALGEEEILNVPKKADNTSL